MTLLSLYDTQRQFVDCRDREAWFAGGIGSGRTTAGAYSVHDLLLDRLKTSRFATATVVAPDLTGLEHAVDVLSSIRRIDGFKKSYPAAGRWFGAAEIYFLLARDLNRYMGKRVCVTWFDGEPLDSATQRELRQHARHGVLRVTTLPAMTLDVPTDMPLGEDGATVFRASTQDNPSLPADYVELLKVPYDQFVRRDR